MIGYRPNPTQAKIHRSRATVLQIVGAEGGGKSRVTASEVTACIPWCRLVYIVGQTYDNPRTEFNYLVENLHELGALDIDRDVSRPKQGPWSMTTRTGCHIITLSVERGASSIIAKGEQPDIIVLAEAGTINSVSVLTAAVRRATRARGRVIAVGTLKDDFGWYAALTDELAVAGNAWQGETFSLPAWSNTFLYPGGENDPEILRLKALLPDDEFARTVAAKKMPSMAQVLREFSYAQHVRECPFDPSLPVRLWIDPGWYPGAYAVVVVQFHGYEVWQIDEVFVHHHTHQEVIAECKRRPWWSNVERIVMDIAGDQHHASESGFEVWRSLAGRMPYGRRVGVLDGIARHRTFLKPPRLFHDPRCVGTLAEYKRYKLPTDRDGNPISDKPVDKNNHAMKAIAYGLVDAFGFVDRDAGAAQETVIPARDVIKEMDQSDWS